ncbi:hypothetical protein GGX14DRAFT_543509 [Mycena pura]|uniref:F-box domain-containing protein n=1 Tax=Mycena pura TaxID=153505 RepID=A0AAD6VBJ5_9AGAR|nr:hypothetical protein GGX14DRAFT_543509 [Mycena pura]
MRSCDMGAVGVNWEGTGEDLNYDFGRNGQDGVSIGVEPFPDLFFCCVQFADGNFVFHDLGFYICDPATNFDRVSRQPLTPKAMSTPSARTRIADIEAQIMKHENSIRELHAEKERIRKQLHAYRYPVLTIPTEIICEIFTRALPVYPDRPHMTRSHSPTNLTQICRRWREIALSTPILWRAVSLETARARQAPSIAAWLSKSGSFPLSIHATSKYEWVADELLDAILPYRARWEHIRLHLPESALASISGRMPLLRQVELAVSPIGSLKSIAWLRNSYAPRLRAAILWEFHYIPSLECIPWTQLTALTLVHTTPIECIPILLQAVNLVYCELIFACVRTETVPNTIITLASLKTLVLGRASGIGDFPSAEFLETFVVPALLSLRVHVQLLDLWPIPCNTLKILIENSGCKLDKICITGSSERHPDYRNIFPDIPRILFDEEGDKWQGKERERTRTSMADVALQT